MSTELEKNGILEVSGIAANWDYKASKPTGWPAKPRLVSIKFVPGAANDKLVVREQEAGGPRIVSWLCENTYDQRVEYYHGTIQIPFVLFSECTLSSGHLMIIKLWREA